MEVEAALSMSADAAHDALGLEQPASGVLLTNSLMTLLSTRTMVTLMVTALAGATGSF